MKKIIIGTLFTILLTSCQGIGNNTLNVDNEKEVLAIAYKDYTERTEMEEVLEEQAFLENESIKTLKYDYNKDEIEDMLVYSDLASENSFDTVTIVTVKDDEFQILQSEIENMYGDNLTQEFNIEEELLVRYGKYEDIDNIEQNYEFVNVYMPTEDNVYNTYLNIPITQQAYYEEKKIDFSIDGGWSEFTVNIKLYDEDTEVIYDKSEIEFILNYETKEYARRLVEAYIKAEEEYIYPREKVSEEEYPNSEFAKRVPNASYSEYIESLENRKLVGFEKETFGSEEINYEQYNLVVIPMYESINLKYADEKIISFKGEYINELACTIFGELENVEVSQYSSMDAEPEVISLGNITNTRLIVMANLANDASRVEVTGQYYEGEGTYSDVKIVLDNMRDLSEYTIITK